jgi:hypothetical protein
MRDRKVERKIRGSKAGAVCALVCSLLLFFTACEQFFTTSPLEWAQRDPSSLPKEQRIAYAEQALGSGDKKELKKAYDAIKNIDDPDTQYLASQVAIEASGINDAITNALKDPENVDTQKVLDDIDGEWLENAEKSMSEAEDGGAEISSEDYVAMAAAMAIRYGQESGGDLPPVSDDGDPGTDDIETTTPDKNGTTLQKSAYYLEKSGYSISDMDDLLGLAQ